jgi:hypothetical protein
MSMYLVTAKIPLLIIFNGNCILVPTLPIVSGNDHLIAPIFFYLSMYFIIWPPSYPTAIVGKAIICKIEIIFRSSTSDRCSAIRLILPRPPANCNRYREAIVFCL